MQLEHGHSAEEIAERLAAPRRPPVLRDSVYGGIDGAVTTFAIVAGVAGADLSTKVIIALGIANVLADGFSMAAGNFTGTKAELDDVRRLRAVEARHIELVPEGEREELRQILARKGLEGPVLEDAVAVIARDKGAWIEMMLVEEYGLSPVAPHPLRAALFTVGAFLLAGMVPMLPFLLGISEPFRVSMVATGVVFFVIGTLKGRWSETPFVFAMWTVRAGIDSTPLVAALEAAMQRAFTTRP